MINKLKHENIKRKKTINRSKEMDMKKRREIEN